MGDDESRHSPSRRDVLKAIPAAGLVGAGLSETGAASGSAPAGTWPMRSYDAAGTGYVPNGFGPTSSVDLKWKFDAGDWISWSSPAVADGKVFIGSSDWNLYAVDVNTGREAWRFNVGDDVQTSPAILDGTVYIGSEDGTVYALDVGNGALQWETDLFTDLEISGMRVANGAVYVGGEDGNVFKLDAASGSQRWEFDTGTDVDSHPAIANGRVFAGSGSDVVYAIDDANGSEIWSFSTDGAVDGAPAVANGTVYFGTRSFSTEGTLYAVDAATGAEQWRFTDVEVDYSGPSVGGGKVYFGDDDGYLHAVDANSGSEIWEFGGSAGANIASDPMIVGGTVYYGDYNWNVFAVDASNGQELWRYQLGDVIDSSPAVVNGTVYIGCDDHNLYALQSPNRAPRAKFSYSPKNAKMGESVSFDGSASTDPDGTVQGYSWDFDDDGSSDASGAKVSHAFQQAGDVPVTLTVTDNKGGAGSKTRTVPVEFLFLERSKKESLASTVDQNSVLSAIESKTGASLTGDPEMATATLDALTKAVNDGRVSQFAAEGAFQRHLAAEQAANDVLTRVGPAGNTNVNLARTTAKFVAQTAVDLLLIVAAIKAGAAGVGVAAATMITDAVGYLFAEFTNPGQVTDLKREMQAQCRAKAEGVATKIQNGSLSTVEAISDAVNSIVDGIVETFAAAFRSFVELEQYNAILNGTTEALPSVPELPSTSLYGSLGRLDAAVQPENLETGIPGSTETAVATIEGTRPKLNAAIEGVTEDVEGLGEVGNQVNLYEGLLDMLNGNMAPWEVAATAATFIKDGLLGAVFKSIASVSGALSFVVIKETYDEMVQAAIEGREVNFTHV